MVPEVAAAVSKRPTATSKHRVTGRTDALCTGSSDAYAENIVRGTETPLSWAISLSEDRDQGDRDCVHGRDLIAGKLYFS